MNNQEINILLTALSYDYHITLDFLLFINYLILLYSWDLTWTQSTQNNTIIHYTVLTNDTSLLIQFIFITYIWYYWVSWALFQWSLFFFFMIIIWEVVWTDYSNHRNVPFNRFHKIYASNSNHWAFKLLNRQITGQLSI